MAATIADFSDVPINEIPLTICKLSFDAHLKRYDLLELELKSDCSEISIPKIFAIDNALKLIRFVNIQARNHCTAIHFYRMYLSSSPRWTAKKLFNELYPIWASDKESSDSVSGRVMGLLSRDIDIFELGKNAIKNQAPHDVYVVLSCVEKCFPFLKEFCIHELVDFIKSQFNLESRGQITRTFYDKLSDQLSFHPNVTKQLYDLVLDNISEALIGLYITSLHATCKAGESTQAFSMILRDINSESSIVKRASLSAIGLLTRFWESDTKLKRDILKLLFGFADSSEECSSHALRVMSQVSSSQPELILELVRRVNKEKTDSLIILRDFVCFNRELLLEQEDLAVILAPLSNLGATDIDHLDYTLSDLSKIEKCSDIITDWLTSWAMFNCKSLRAEDKLSRSFNQLISELHNSSKLMELLTKWAISENRELGIALGDVISELWVRNLRQPTFSKEILDTLTHEDFKLLARRMLGWVHHGEALLSLTFSLLDTDDAKCRTFEWVHTLLSNEIGRNYPQASLKEIEAKLNVVTGDENKLLQSIFEELSLYSGAIDDLPFRNELRPPELLRRSNALKQNRQQREVQEVAQRDSIMQQLSNQIPLKAGNGWFSIREDKISNIGRLSSHSIEATLPVNSIIDPVNDEITRLGYRVAKRVDE